MGPNPEVAPLSISVHSEFGAWSKRATLGLLVILCILMLWVSQKVDRNFEGNPNGGGRQLQCAMAKDDAAADPEVAKVVKEFCP